MCVHLRVYDLVFCSYQLTLLVRVEKKERARLKSIKFQGKVKCFPYRLLCVQFGFNLCLVMEKVHPFMQDVPGNRSS
jgi:hypothetical protein